MYICQWSVFNFRPSEVWGLTVPIPGATPTATVKIPISWPVGAPHQHVRACFIRSSDGGSELTIDNDIMMTCHVGYTQKEPFHENLGFAQNLEHGGTGLLPQRCLAQRGVHAGSPSPIHA